jgi:hypothetical protein
MPINIKNVDQAVVAVVIAAGASLASGRRPVR